MINLIVVAHPDDEVLGFGGTGKLLVKAGEENAGLVDIGDGLACAFKIESHNHPSSLAKHTMCTIPIRYLYRSPQLALKLPLKPVMSHITSLRVMELFPQVQIKCILVVIVGKVLNCIIISQILIILVLQ